MFRTTLASLRYRVQGPKDLPRPVKMRWRYAISLHENPDTTLADIRKAVETLESVARSWKLVFGEAHPETSMVRAALEEARKKLAARTA